LKASRISSSESVSFIFLAIMVKNSVKLLIPSSEYVQLHILPGKSMVPLLSASTSLIMSCSSDSEGFWPRDRMTVPSSLVVICPVCSISVPALLLSPRLCSASLPRQRELYRETFWRTDEAVTQTSRKSTDRHHPYPKTDSMLVRGSS
jgi:hypothetical protein